MASNKKKLTSKDKLTRKKTVEPEKKPVLTLVDLLMLADRGHISTNELRKHLGFDPMSEVEEKEVIDSRRLMDGSCETLFEDGSRIIALPVAKSVKSFSDLPSPWNTIDFSSPIVPEVDDRQPGLFEKIV